jgi:hypothetical protein
MNVNSLTQLFPSTTVEVIQEELARTDLQDMVPAYEPAEDEHLAQLQGILGDIDPTLRHVAGDRIDSINKRNLYLRNHTEGESHALYGDQLPENVQALGSGHHYQENVSGGRSKAQYGDRVGMRDFFA